MSFADRAIERLRAKGTPLCVGFDPHTGMIPPLFGDAREALEPVAKFFHEIVPIAARHAVAVKPQLGLFEPYGEAGFALARQLCAEAKAAGLIVILDAKRGDIGSTAEGYARAAFVTFDADGVTTNPYLGMDSLEPFLVAAEKDARGVSVLVRTSNPGARDLQDLKVDGHPLWERVAEMLAPAAKRLTGASGWSGLMPVCGATYPGEARRLRELLPNTLFLIPGYGAQGAGATDAAISFVPGPNGREGGFISSSRAALYPPAAAKAASLAEWRQAVDAAMAGAAAELAQAIQG
jgi:orotidine-5'-phosphate decarboxylase